MNTVLARQVICFTGSWSSFDGVARLVHDVGGANFKLDREFSSLTPDPRMPQAFEASIDPVSPSFSEQDRHAVLAHRAVAYVLSPPMEARASIAVSARMLKVVAALLDVGGATAAKGDSSGLGHGKARWLELAGRTEKDAVSLANALRLMGRSTTIRRERSRPLLVWDAPSRRRRCRGAE